MAWRGHEPPEPRSGLRGSERGEAQAAPPPNGYGSQGGSEGLPPPIPMPRGGSAARSACKNHKNPSQNGSFSFVADPKAPFVPILPQDLKAVAPAEKFFRSLGSKTDPVLHIQYPPEWADVLKNPKPKDWRPVWKDIRNASLGPQ